jgi:uncharacterized membrane protein (DUF373 family)
MSLGSRAAKVYDWVERVIVIALLLMLIVVVVLSTWSFCESLIGRIAVKVGGGVAADEQWGALLRHRMGFLREVFSGFLLLLIGIELMKTVVMYLQSHVLHVEVVLTVAIIAVARHTIDLDLETANPLLLIGIGVVVLSLSLGYYLFRRSIGPNGEGK